MSIMGERSFITLETGLYFTIAWHFKMLKAYITLAMLLAMVAACYPAPVSSQINFNQGWKALKDLGNAFNFSSNGGNYGGNYDGNYGGNYGNNYGQNYDYSSGSYGYGGWGNNWLKELLLAAQAMDIANSAKSQRNFREYQSVNTANTQNTNPCLMKMSNKKCNEWCKMVYPKDQCDLVYPVVTSQKDEQIESVKAFLALLQTALQNKKMEEVE